MLNIDLDTRQLEKVADELQATDDQVRLALNSTIRKINTSVRREAMRQMSKDTGLPQKRFARRVRSYKLGRNAAGGFKIFIGLDSINLMEMNAKETQLGVKARTGEFKGAFIAVGRQSGIVSVFKREKKGRLPIAQIRHSVENTGDEILAAAEKIFDARFWKTFDGELRWRTQTAR